MSGKMLGCGNIVQVPGLPGSNGFDGAAVQMRIDTGFIQWKLADSADWIPLIALSDLTGPAGDPGATGDTGAAGTDAKNIDLQTNATHIQWRYIGEAWQNLVALTSLVGPVGPDGATGVGIASIAQTAGTGAPGTINTYTITYTDASTTTFGVYQGADGATGATGADGADGAPGADGAAGADGTAALTAHELASDPHPQYALESALGNAASRDVGTTPGTVAAGNDSRLADVANKVDKVAGKSLSKNDFTDALKTKLEGVADAANNYTHPANHPPSIITQDASNRFVTDTEKSTWNAKEPAITAGTTAQYLRGDKTWQPVADLPVSTAQAAAIATVTAIHPFLLIGA